MFEMFEREAWPHERRRAYILAKAALLADESAEPLTRVQTQSDPVGEYGSQRDG
jgi:hypothetical protein